MPPLRNHFSFSRLQFISTRLLSLQALYHQIPAWADKLEARDKKQETRKQNRNMWANFFITASK